MKLNKNFILHNADGETMLVSTGAASFSGLVKSNKTAAAMLEMLQKDTTEEEIVSALRARWSAPDGVIEKDVKNVLARLKKIGALDV